MGMIGDSLQNNNIFILKKMYFMPTWEYTVEAEASAGR